MISNLINPEELHNSLLQPDVLVADCRFDLADPSRGRKCYEAGHVPGAMYVSLDEHLSAPVGKHGGRHPLPEADVGAGTFGKLGISRNITNVVVYDDAGGSFAARMWWMLKYIGHDNVRLLNGGLQAWIEYGGAVHEGVETPKPVAFGQAEIRKWMLAEFRDIVAHGASDPLVDARAPERYSGETEPIDNKAGHIPGAINLYWQGNLDLSMRMLPREALRARYAGLSGRPVIYCGSGVTSCINVLAMQEAGLPRPRLYVGSWSDWISRPENPVATGNEP